MTHVLGAAARLLCCGAFALQLNLTPARAGSSWLFVSLDGEDRIVSCRRDPASGALEAAASTPTTGSPAALSFDPKRRVLFAALRSGEQLASFKFDPGSGGLAPISVVKVQPDPAYLSLDRSGRWLFSAYYVAGKVAVHRVDAAGAIGAEATWYPTADKAHAALADPSNRWLLVPHTGAEAIYRFRFEAGRGTLVGGEPAFVRTAPGTGPRHVVFHPHRPVAYTVNEQGGSVTSWRFDSADGALDEPQTHPTLPAGFAGGNACADLEITPDAKWLFASNRGHDSLACFRVDPVSGRLHPASRTATEATPRQFSITPDGRYLYAAGQSSGKIASFRIDSDAGELERIATLAVGDRPWWVLAVDIP